MTALLAGSPARAQDVADRASLVDLPLEELLLIDVSASAKVAQPLRESPSVGTVVTRGQMDGYGWLSLNDVLFRQPGFAPSRDFERLTVAARGLFESWNNNHLLLLVDGVPFNNNTNGWAFTWDLLPTPLIETVEIIRGPGSALYGSNATNGVVALRTRPAIGGPPTVIEARARVGNAGTRVVDLVGSQRGKWLSLLAAYGFHSTDGDERTSYDGSGRADAGGLLRFPVDERSRSHYLFAKLQGEGALRGLSLQLHLHRWNFGTGHGWLFVVPEEQDRAIQDRGLLWLAYRAPPLLDGRLQLELVVKGQNHEVDYRIKYLPDQFTFASVLYPGGVVEVARTSARDLFARAQAQLRFWRDMTLLLGVENTIVAWPADAEHTANVDINRGGTLMPLPGNQLLPARPVFEAIVDHPIENLGLYLQYTSGRMWQRRLATTLGVRYDLQLLEYRDLDLPDRPVRSRSLQQLSPRAALVGFPHEDLAIKLLAERAFRAPAPTEQFVANSLLGNSSLGQLQPEQITTITAAVDWTALRRLTVRADWFYQRFANQIAFSTSKNFSANLYTRETTGFETELLFDAALGGDVTVGGFANHTFVHLLSETVTEPTIIQSEELTWAPGQVANLGVQVSRRRLAASLQGHYQGAVRRRRSDSFNADGTPTDFSAYRPAEVAPWFTVDARIAYRPWDWLRVGVQGSNLLDSGGALIKNNDYPFDYAIAGRRILGTVEWTPAIGRRPAGN